MSAASYYDKTASQDDQQPGLVHSGAQGYGQDTHSGMHEQQQQQQQQQQQRGFPQQGYNAQSGDGIYNGQKPNMGNSNYAQGPQQMNGNGNYVQGAQQMNGNDNYAQQIGGRQGAVADDRDTLTKCNDNFSDYKKENNGQLFPLTR